jgi:hypothetical protein
MPLKQSWLDAEASSGGRVTFQGSPEEIKAQFQAVGEAIGPLLPSPSTHVEWTDGKAGSTGYRTYRAKAAQGDLPIVLWRT